MRLEITEKDNSSKKSMKVIGTYVSQEIYDKLLMESKEDFITISSLIKKIIYKYLENK